MAVSPEIMAKLTTYQALLEKWQPKINLISNNTLGNAWERHFEDSMQLLDIFPSGQKTLFDLGCGAGFPGLVLAIMSEDLDVHLVESDQKKCSFLKTVSRETETNVTIHNCRIENLSLDIKPNIIMARALASLDKLFDYCEKWFQDNSEATLIFPKGERAEEELAVLEKIWKFNLRTCVSKTDENGKILVFTDVCPV